MALLYILFSLMRIYHFGRVEVWCLNFQYSGVIVYCVLAMFYKTVFGEC